MGLSRAEFFARVGLFRDIEPLTDESYRFAEAQEEAKSDQGVAVDDPWHVSFHGSQFPGDDVKACPRASLYRMMDIPRKFGSYMFSNRKLVQISDAGKDIEDRLVAKWYNAGYLLSPPPWAGQQVFSHPEVWLTSTVDAITLPARSNVPVVAEVKTKYADVIADMRNLARGPDEKHVKQLKTQIAMARAFYTTFPQTVFRCHNTDRLSIYVTEDWIAEEGSDRLVVREGAKAVCPQHGTDKCLYECELVPPSHGYLYYVSRDNPCDTWEFYFSYDEKFFQAGLEKLAEWRQAFIDGVLPSTNFADKRFSHPFGWRWGEQPCQWCDFGDSCRVDHKRAVKKGEPIRLEESDAVESAQSVRETYALADVREDVFARWDDTPGAVPEDML